GDGEPRVEGERGRQRPAANDSILNVTGIASKLSPFAEWQVVHRVAVELAGDIRDASPVVGLGVVRILVEERKAGLARSPGKSLFVAEGPEVTEATRLALGPGVVGAELQALPRPLLGGDL